MQSPYVRFHVWGEISCSIEQRLGNYQAYCSSIIPFMLIYWYAFFYKLHQLSHHPHQ